ncbi:MAG: serine hydrolase domain-containing protein [Myxococcota bacterium]
MARCIGWLRRTLVGGLVVTACDGADDPSDAAALPPTPEAIAEDLQRFAPSVLDEHGVVGASIVVIHRGEPVWALAHGTADTKTGAPVTTDTVFNVGSISKVATAWSIMTAVEAGQLDLDRPIVEHLAQWKPPASDLRWSEITPRLLLGHRSGATLGSGGGLIGYDDGEALPSLGAVLDGTRGAKNPPLVLQREPGAATIYSAGGYALAQAVLEDATHQTLAQHAQRTVFAPLAMRRSTFAPPVSNAARGHNAYGDRYAPLRFAAYGAAGLYTTAGDLGRLLAAASEVGPHGGGGGAISPRAAVDMRRAPPDSGRRAFGLGWQRQLVTVDGKTHELIGHEGKNRGYVSAAKLFPVTGDGIIVLTNSDRADVPLHQITCRYLTWRVRGGHCLGPHNRPERWSTWWTIALAGLGIHGASLAIQFRRPLREWRRPRGTEWLRPCLAVAAAIVWCVVLYTSAAASLILGAHDQIPYLYFGRGAHWLTATVVMIAAWLALTAWMRKTSV